MIATSTLNAATKAPVSAAEARITEPEAVTVPDGPSFADFASDMTETVMVVELNKTGFGKTRKVGADKAEAVTELLGTSRGATTVTKKLYPPNEPYTKRVNSLLAEASSIHKRMTIAYRAKQGLIPVKLWDEYKDKMVSLKTKLRSALGDIDEHRDEILEVCREWLNKTETGDTFDITQYPASYADTVRIDYEVVPHELSEKLKKADREAYNREKRRLSMRFEAAISAFEEESRDNLSKLVDALLAKLNPEDGKKVKYTEAATNNLREFFGRFKQLDASNDSALNDLIADAEKSLGGVTMADLKKSAGKRATVITNAPVRNIDLSDLD